MPKVFGQPPNALEDALSDLRVQFGQVCFGTGGKLDGDQGLPLQAQIGRKFLRRYRLGSGFYGLKRGS
jgi:hypothetical protein